MTVLGIFQDREMAEETMMQLKEAGYRPQDISVLVNEKVMGTVDGKGKGENVAEGAVKGAVTGGVVGGLVGLLVGVGAVTIPGLGALFIGGPLAATLGLTGAAATAISAATSGAVAGGLVGVLVGWGVPEEVAKIYETRIKEGAVVLAVGVGGSSEEARVSQIFEENGAEQVRVVDTERRSK